jgi:uncharacterized membrane protein (DUF373 family)
MAREHQEGDAAGAGEREGTRAAGYIRGPLGAGIDRLASLAITAVVSLLVLLMALVLVWAVVVLAIVVVETIRQQDVGHIKDLVIGVLTIFIVIEIFDLFREYLRSAHIKVVNLAEVSIAVVLRELWLLLLEGSENWQLYIALALVVAAVAAFWWLTTRYAAARDVAGPAAQPAGGSETPPSDQPAAPGQAPTPGGGTD